MLALQVALTIQAEIGEVVDNSTQVLWIAEGSTKTLHVAGIPVLCLAPSLSTNGHPAWNCYFYAQNLDSHLCEELQELLTRLAAGGSISLQNGCEA